MTAAWDWAGAKWWKFDFHNHTPISEDYGKGPDQTQLKQILPQDWLLNYMRQGIDCVAVTDHNSGAWIDVLKEALNELASKGHPDYRPLYLFPGVEITVQGNIHILAIFGPDKTTSDIDSLLGAVKYRATKGKSDGCSECSAGEVIDEIIQSGGLAIPAHVDQDSGLLKAYSGNTLEQVLETGKVFAMEVTDLSWKKPQIYISKNLNWAEVLGTDSHHPSGTEGQRYPGSHFTWVKMSKPSYDGLKLALIDGALSLKRSDGFSSDPNTYGQLAIESIVVNDAKYLGRGNAFSCQLNPWLNTIIGGRGTGKSTSLEFLRLALSRMEEIPESLKAEFGKYSQTSSNRHDEGLLINNTKITVGFRKDGGRFRVTCSNSNTEKKYTIEEENASGTWNVSEGNIAQRFPIRIYSQKQIFELAKQPDALLQVVDDAPAVNYHDWQVEWDRLFSKYLSIRAQEREVESGLQGEAVIKGQIEDVKRKLEVLEKVDHESILKTYQLRQNQSNAIDSWEKTWEYFDKSVWDISKTLLPRELDSQYFDAECADDKELFEAVDDIRVIFEKLQNEMNSIAQRIDNAKREWRQARPDLKISKKITIANQEYTKYLAQFNTVEADGSSTYDALVKQKQDLEEKLNGLYEKRKTLVQHHKNAEECLIKLREHRAKITKLRKDFLEATLIGNSYVQINVIPYGNKSTVEEEFRKLIGRSRGFERDIGEVNGNECLLSLLSDTSKTIEDRITSLKSLLYGIHTNDATAVAKAKDRRFVSHIQGLTPEQIDRINCWLPEDSLDIRYSLKDGGSFNPVEQGSPGQKTAALLAFILSYGNEPLVLDQPEDDLDNHLIYDLIVTQLREIKQKRQVLVVTHNANIVVNGDAENVIVLEVRTGQTQITTQGGLQDPSIRDKICQVLEGGKEAFNQRYKRINAGDNKIS